MKNKFLSFIAAILLSVGIAHANPTELPPIPFGGGVDYKTVCSEIRDDRACDSSNMVSDIYGTSAKRNGSVRYISQAVSSNPVTSLYRAYASSGSFSRHATIMASGDKLYRSTNDVNPYWTVLSSNLAVNQRYDFETMRGKVIIAGDALQNPILQYDIMNDTITNLLSNDGSTETIIVRGKYQLQSKNYYLIANTADLTNGTSYYPSRLNYSLLNRPSSMTALRFIDFRPDDGEQITGIGEIFGRVHIFKPSSIHELTFTALNLQANGGDQAVEQLVQGFGVLAPRTLVNTGQFYIFLAKDGIREWDGGRRSRLTVAEESRVISQPVEPIINDIIRNGKIDNCVAIYYPKRQWYVFAYEDFKKFPRGRANSVLVYDLVTGEWFPFNGWFAGSLMVQDGVTDEGELFYGDSNDGYVYQADAQSKQNDARQELVIETMDSTSTVGGTELWHRGTQDIADVLEGTGSIRLTLSNSIPISSTSHMAVMNIGEWPSKQKITRDDKIAFKVFIASIQNISNIRIDLEINDVESDFDANFTSVTVSSGSLVAGNTAWTTIEIPISSFPILNDWTDLKIESFPFASSLTFYGVRLVAQGVGDAYAAFDDLRVVQASENPLNAFRLTKQFNMQTVADKRFRQVWLNTEKSADSSFAIDVFTNFGEFTNRIDVPATFEKEVFVSGYGQTEGVARLSSVDFSLIAATRAVAASVFAVRPLVADSKYIYGGDQYNNRLIKFSKSDLTTFVSTYGSLGSGSTNFNLIYQMAVDDKNLYVCDFLNQRIKVHRKSDFGFVGTFGTLGSNTTSFHNPSGIAVDETYAYVAQDGNHVVQKLNKSTGAFIDSVDLNQNTIGDTTLAVDDQYLYVAYNTISQFSVNDQDVFLEKRNKTDLSLVNKITLRPKCVSELAISTYAILGDISVSDDYIFISFTDDINRHGSYYLQKRLKSDFSLVLENKSALRNFAITHNGVTQKPKRQTIVKDLLQEGDYVQLKYSDSGLDNTMKLFNQGFLIKPEGIREK